MNYESLYDRLINSPLEKWLTSLPADVTAALSPNKHGNMPQWQSTINDLPILQPSVVKFDSDYISIGHTDDCDTTIQYSIEQALRQLAPWRKGPYSIYGINIESEWRSNWKWDRLIPHIKPLKQRTVLDVGCGNGYHCWRMLGEDAKLVIGVDPTLSYIMQYQAIRHFTGEQAAYVLPLALEALPENLKAFDTVFSMGVLYHRRSPIEHLMKLRQCLRENGELILETLVIDSKDGGVLTPTDRYAKMRNVWFIPSCQLLETWLKRCGFRNIKLVDINQTSIKEQCSTDWAGTESLVDFLDNKNQDLTIEGYPAPKRAIYVASIN